MAISNGHVAYTTRTIQNFVGDLSKALVSFALTIVQVLHLEIDYHSLTKRTIQADAADVAHMEERLTSVAANMEVSTTPCPWVTAGGIEVNVLACCSTIPSLYTVVRRVALAAVHFPCPVARA